MLLLRTWDAAGVDAPDLRSSSAGVSHCAAVAATGLDVAPDVALDEASVAAPDAPPGALPDSSASAAAAVLVVAHFRLLALGGLAGPVPEWEGADGVVDDCAMRPW